MCNETKVCDPEDEHPNVVCGSDVVTPETAEPYARSNKINAYQDGTDALRKSVRGVGNEIEVG